MAPVLCCSFGSTATLYGSWTWLTCKLESLLSLATTPRNSANEYVSLVRSQAHHSNGTTILANPCDQYVPHVKRKRGVDESIWRQERLLDEFLPQTFGLACSMTRIYWVRDSCLVGRAPAFGRKPRCDGSDERIPLASCRATRNLDVRRSNSVTPQICPATSILPNSDIGCARILSGTRRPCAEILIYSAYGMHATSRMDLLTLLAAMNVFHCSALFCDTSGGHSSTQSQDFEGQRLDISLGQK
ncbi:hypothetical protein DFH09DRAFT_287249 [Mycena vulgaris]|nr:hypothetical protein DFH09DRAFT_287249 [Mycena vulgaris]